VNRDEAKKAQEELLGLWPSPRPSHAEDTVLLALLAQYSLEEYQDALGRLASQIRPLRPAPAELLACLRGVRQRAADRAASRAGLPEAPPADPAGWIAPAREALERTQLPPSQGRAARARAAKAKEDADLDDLRLDP
jgi:hypothetical protein